MKALFCSRLFVGYPLFKAATVLQMLVSPCREGFMVRARHLVHAVKSFWQATSTSGAQACRHCRNQWDLQVVRRLVRPVHLCTRVAQHPEAPMYHVWGYIPYVTLLMKIPCMAVHGRSAQAFQISTGHGPMPSEGNFYLHRTGVLRILKR